MKKKTNITSNLNSFNKTTRDGDVGLPELKGLMYTLGVPGQAERFMRTTKAIAKHVGTTIGKEMWTLVEKREETTFEKPAPPDKDDTDPTSMSYGKC
jgi:hypothetical protein